MNEIQPIEGITPGALWTTAGVLLGLAGIAIIVFKIIEFYWKAKDRKEQHGQKVGKDMTDVIADKVLEKLAPRFNDIDKKLAKIKYRSFSQFEIVVLHALVVLTEHYASRRNKLWFSTIRVFLTGTNTSHLYQQCKSLPYFGHEPNVKYAELMSALNNFVDLELINEFKNSNSKAYYEINTELISKSHILDDTDNSSFDDDFNID